MDLYGSIKLNLMDKFRTQGLGGLPLVLDDLRWFFGRLGSPNEGIYQAFNNLLRGFGNNFIVQGIVIAGSSPTLAISEGWVLLDGELLKVDNQFNIDTSTDNKFVKVTTFDSRGNKTFQNATIEDTYEKNRAVVQGTSGNLDFDDNTFSDLRTIADISGTDTPIKKKIIDIGDWNMDVDSTVSVSHGISDFKKIRSIEIIIRDDGDNFYTILNAVNTTGAIEGGVGLFDGTNIILTRTSGGLFDATGFDSTSFNRGFITVEFKL